MGNGYGFHTPGTRPGPDPQNVGAMLMQGQVSQAQPQMAGPMMAGRPQAAPPHVVDAMLRTKGGELMGSGGPDEHGDLAAAVGEALTRRGGGFVGNQNPHKNRAAHIAHLQRLGISELEATLLGEAL